MIRIHGTLAPWRSGTDFTAGAINARKGEIEDFTGLAFELIQEDGLGFYYSIRGILNEEKSEIAFEIYLKQEASVAFLALGDNQASEVTARYVLVTLGIPIDKIQFAENWPKEPFHIHKPVCKE